ncbi:uncharacterized protein LOC6533597 [Drosophila yakuba]|uniref:MSP domain-containing protein n=1 Tax=Drosophila yakuba TaxID=7245 RepID=B4PE21_DROYA|nr:uncharacterized protein LOC6533597 [Drosophila yakuba]EDW94017.1 uncharacterized protein Dyak_GE20270 [Drosophila yakuba]
MSANSNSLEVSPNSTLTFTKSNDRQEITIRNVGEKTVTYKVQSTVHGKFNIRPRWGVLNPNEHSHVVITMCKDAELSRKGRDKIVVVCMVSPINAVDFDMTTSFWRHNICYDPNIEKHHLTCHQINGQGVGDGEGMDVGVGNGGDKDAVPDDLRFRRGLFPSFCSIRIPSKYWR